MSSSSPAPYIHPGSVLKHTHQRTTSRCENVLRDLLAKDADRHPRRPFVSTERTRLNNDSVKHWLAQTDSSTQSQLVLSSPSSLTRSNSLSSKPTYPTTHLPATTNVSHSALANNDNDADPLSASPSSAVPEPHTQPSSHFAHTQAHRSHQSLNGPLAFQPSPSPRLAPNRSHPLPGRPIQHQTQTQTQNTSIPTRNSSLGPFGAPTQSHQTPPSPIQCPATAPNHRNRSTSMSPTDLQNGHPRLPPRIARKPSASSAHMLHTPVRSISHHHPQPRLHPAFLTDWTTAESPDDESTPSLTPPTASSRNLSFTDSMPATLPLERTFSPPCTPPSFDIRVANEACRSIQGYVSFFEVEGLGRPLAEVEEERLECERMEKEQQTKRNWLAWLSSGVFRASSTPSGA